MRCRIVEKSQHQRVPIEGLLHDSALYARSAAMNEPHFMQSYSVRLVEVLFDDRWDIARGENVEIELALDRNPQRVLILHFPLRRGV